MTLSGAKLHPDSHPHAWIGSLDRKSFDGGIRRVAKLKWRAELALPKSNQMLVASHPANSSETKMETRRSRMTILSSEEATRNT